MSNSRAKELFTQIIESFIVEIENGNNPFNFGKSAPINTNTKKPYTGLNKLVLSYYAALNKYTSNKWLTMKQVGVLKGRVLKGEKATPIFFFQDSYAVKVVKNGKEETIWSRKKTAEEAKAEVLGKKGVTEVISVSKKMVLKHFYVFNYNQTTLHDEDIIPISQQPAAIRVAVSKQVKLDMSDSKIVLYKEEEDTIYGAFSEILNFEDFFKIIVESTKHPIRLDRNLEYVEEELVKLIGSSYLMGLTGLKINKISPELAEIFIQKMKQSPNSLWKYAREADRAYNMVNSWIKEIKAAKEVA